MDTAKVAKLVHASITSTMTKDIVAGSFNGYSIVESFARKEKEKWRGEIYQTGKTNEKINGLITSVDKTGVPESLLLFKGREFSCVGNVRQGKTFVDMEVLRLQLSMPKDAWEAAVRMATHRRSPEVLFQIARLG